MPGIHYKKDMESEEEVEIQVVGDNLQGVQTVSHNSETVKQPTQIPPTGPSLPATQVDLLPSAPANSDSSERQAVENTEEQDEDQEGEDIDEEEHDGDSNNDGDGEAVEHVSVIF